MLYNEWTDIGAGTYPAKSNNSKECMICHYWFFNLGFEFEDHMCNGCHDLIMLSVNVSNIPIITVKNYDYHCNIHNISKSEAIHWKILCSKIMGTYIKILS